jgi:hypothetical protein
MLPFMDERACSCEAEGPNLRQRSVPNLFDVTGECVARPSHQRICCTDVVVLRPFRPPQKVSSRFAEPFSSIRFVTVFGHDKLSETQADSSFLELR